MIYLQIQKPERTVNIINKELKIVQLNYKYNK